MSEIRPLTDEDRIRGALTAISDEIHALSEAHPRFMDWASEIATAVSAMAALGARIAALEAELEQAVKERDWLAESATACPLSANACMHFTDGVECLECRVTAAQEATR